MFDTCKRKMNAAYAKLRFGAMLLSEKLREKSGAFVMEHTVLFVLILVIAAVIITLLIAFVKYVVAPTIETKTLDFFNMS